MRRGSLRFYQLMSGRIFEAHVARRILEMVYETGVFWRECSLKWLGSVRLGKWYQIDHLFVYLELWRCENWQNNNRG